MKKNIFFVLFFSTLTSFAVNNNKIDSESSLQTQNLPDEIKQITYPYLNKPIINKIISDQGRNLINDMKFRNINDMKFRNINMKYQKECSASNP